MIEKSGYNLFQLKKLNINLFIYKKIIKTTITIFTIQNHFIINLKT